jgi:hypothetical protein
MAPVLVLKLSFVAFRFSDLGWRRLLYATAHVNEFKYRVGGFSPSQKFDPEDTAFHCMSPIGSLSTSSVFRPTLWRYLSQVYTSGCVVFPRTGVNGLE